MGRVGVAFRAFFKALFDFDTANRVDQALKGEFPKLEPVPAPKATPSKPVAAAPIRSDAVTLLALLQREARLVDLVQQPLGEFTDAQIGAAARDVITNTAAVLKRVMDVGPAGEAEEGAAISVPADYDAGAITLSGNVPNQGPYQGKVVHAGWKARQCVLPAWTGGKAAAMVIAPVEVEVG